jgi:hypothetical protein
MRKFVHFKQNFLHFTSKKRIGMIDHGLPVAPYGSDEGWWWLAGPLEFGRRHAHATCGDARVWPTLSSGSDDGFERPRMAGSARLAFRPCWAIRCLPLLSGVGRFGRSRTWTYLVLPYLICVEILSSLLVA